MRLPLVSRKKSKKESTLDTVASVAKAWGEWQLAKGAVKTAKGAPWKLIGGIAAGAAAAGVAAKKLTGRGGSSTASPPSQAAYTGPVPDPNAPGESSESRGTTPAPPRGPLDSSDAPGAGPTDQGGTTGASPAAPPASTSTR